mmetsp:Transcript_30415/g.87153  ORF Transcript_30415/g.87153 Transcript_30415/m.87153 type:complete len:355 (-) Transcript_30415:27-1091(-)
MVQVWHIAFAHCQLFNSGQQLFGDARGAELLNQFFIVDLPGHLVRGDDHVLVPSLARLRGRRLLLQAKELPTIHPLHLHLDRSIVRGLGLLRIRGLAPEVLGRGRRVDLDGEAHRHLLLLRQDQRVCLLPICSTSGEGDLATSASPGAELPARRQLHEGGSGQPGQAQGVARVGVLPVENAVAVAGLRLAPGQLEDHDFLVGLAEVRGGALHGIEQRLVRSILRKRRPTGAVQADGNLAVARLRHPNRLHVATAGAGPETEHPCRRRPDQKAGSGDRRWRRRRWWPRLFPSGAAGSSSTIRHSRSSSFAACGIRGGSDRPLHQAIPPNGDSELLNSPRDTDGLRGHARPRAAPR